MKIRVFEDNNGNGGYECIVIKYTPAEGGQHLERLFKVDMNTLRQIEKIKDHPQWKEFIKQKFG